MMGDGVIDPTGRRITLGDIAVNDGDVDGVLFPQRIGDRLVVIGSMVPVQHEVAPGGGQSIGDHPPDTVGGAAGNHRDGMVDAEGGLQIHERLSGDLTKTAATGPVGGGSILRRFDKVSSFTR